MLALKTLKDRETLLQSVNVVTVNKNTVFMEMINGCISELKNNKVFVDPNTTFSELKLSDSKKYKILLDNFRKIRILTSYISEEYDWCTKLLPHYSYYNPYLDNEISKRYTLSVVRTMLDYDINKANEVKYILFNMLRTFLDLLLPLAGKLKLIVNVWDKDVEDAMRKDLRKRNVSVQFLKQFAHVTVIKRANKTL